MKIRFQLEIHVIDLKKFDTQEEAVAYVREVFPLRVDEGGAVTVTPILDPQPVPFIVRHEEMAR